MAGGFGFSSGSFGSDSGTEKTDKQKQSTASKQLKSSLSRISGQYGNVDSSSQNQTLLSFGKTGTQDFQEQKDSSLKNKLENFGGGLLADLNVPSQIVLRQIQAQQTKTSHLDALKKALDTSGHQINFRGALNTDNWQTNQGVIDPRAEAAAETQTFIQDKANKKLPFGVSKLDSILAGGVDLGATGVTDPLTYASGPLSLIGKAGKAAPALKAVEEVAGPEIAAQVAKSGTKSLAPDVAAKLRQGLEASDRAGRVKGGPSVYADKILGGTSATGIAARLGAGGNGLTRERGVLEEAQGLKFGGKTVLTQDAFRTGAGKVGALGAVDRFGKLTPVASTFGRLGELSSKLRPRGEFAAAHGQAAADTLGAAEAGNKAWVAEKIADTKNKLMSIERRLPKTANPEDLGREFTDIIENGDWRKEADFMRQSGRPVEAEYLEALQKSSQDLTQLGLDEGTLKVARNTDKYVSHQATPEFLTKVGKMGDAVPDELLSFRPHTTEGVLASTEQKARNFMPGASIAEKNAYTMKKYGVKGFEDNAIKAHGIKAVKTYESIAKVRLAKSLQEMTTVDGVPLLTQIPDNSKHIRDAERVAKLAVKGANKQFPRVPTRKLPEARSSVNKLSKVVEKLRASSEAATAAKAAAAKAGTPNIAPQAAMLDKVFEMKGLLDDLVADPNVSDEIKADAADWLKQSKQALAGEKVAAAAAASGKQVQQKIGATSTAVSYESKLLKSAESELAKAQQVLAKAQAKDTAVRAFKQQKAELKAAEKIERPSGTVKVNAGALGDVYVAPSAAKRLKQLDGNGKATNTITKSFETFTQVQKNLLLNAAPVIVARNVRDFFPNVVNMVAMGFKNPKMLVEAGKVDKALRAAYKQGLSHEEAIARLPKKYRELEENISKSGTIFTQQQRSDITHQGLGVGESNSIGDRTKRGLNVKNAEGWATRHGATANDFADSLQRRAMYYDQVAQHGDFKEAARVTKDTFFDFSDLSPAEQTIRKFIPFYTWTARNLKLQAYLTAQLPAYQVNVARAKQDLFADQDASGNKILPGYALANGQVPIGKVGDVPLLGNIQTPFESATSTIQPLVDIASYFGPEKNVTQAGLKGGIAGLGQNVGGAPGFFGKGLMEQWSGVDAFTGAPLPEKRSDQALRFGLSAVPRGTQYKGITSGATSGNKANQTAAALKLLGVSTTAVTPGRETTEIYNRKRAVETAANRQGIPTATELKKSAAKKKTTKTQSSSK
jgi:hypothetical protein